MEIDKTVLNAIRGVFRREITNAESAEIYAKKNLDFVSNLLNKSSSLIEKFESVKIINENFNTSFSIFTKSKNIINFFNIILIKAKSHTSKVRIAMNCFDKNGINSVTYSFPLFCSFNIGDNRFLNYLSLMGIKYNGTHEKNGKLMDEFEIKLNNYEKDMAKYIQENYTVTDNDIENFKRLYEEYIRYYFNSNTNYVNIDENGMQAILNGMDFYLRQNVLFVESCISEQNEKRKHDEILLCQRGSEVHAKSDVPSKKYWVEHSRILDKEELQKQKNILMDMLRKEQLEKIATPDELIIYNYAKTSGIIEATKIIKEIDAVIDLLLEETDAKEKEYLINDCKEFFNRLANLLNTINASDELDEDVCDLYFSTNDIENVDKCWFIKDLSNIRYESLNSILNNLELIKKGMLPKSKIKSLKGHTGFKEIKDDQIRIVYNHVQKRIIVILGVFIKKADNDIETYNKLIGRSLELTSKEYSDAVYSYFIDYVNENARIGSRK